MSRPTTITGPLAACVAHAGGVAALADDLRVSRNTVRRWGTGEVEPTELGRRAVNAWARRRGLEEPFPIAG